MSRLASMYRFQSLRNLAKKRCYELVPRFSMLAPAPAQDMLPRSVTTARQALWGLSLSLSVLAMALNISTYASPVSAQEFWNSTRAGMSVGEIKKQFPDATVNDDKLSIYTNVLGHISQVNFKFNSGRLEAEEVVIGAGGDIVVQEIKTGLTEKYGQIVGCENVLDKMEKCKWKHGNTTIISSVIDLLGTRGITIDYEVKPTGPNTL